MEHQTLELLKRYALGKMPEGERAAFESRMESDAAFAEEVAGWAAIYKGIQAEGDQRLGLELEALGRQLMRSEAPSLSATPVNLSPKRRPAIPRWMYAAAAVMLLLIVAWPVYQNLQSTKPTYANNKSLFEKHFRALPAPAVRDAQPITWRDAYQNKQYNAAITELEKLLADPNYANRSEANLFLGLSHLAAGQGKEALNAFEKVSSDSFDYDEAQWYSALAWIIIDDVVHAKPMLKGIAANGSHPHRKEAEEILKALE